MSDAWSRLAALPVTIDGAALDPLRLDVGGWVRHTAVVRLKGAGCEGRGEDVTWEARDQSAFQREGLPIDLRGRTTLGELSCRIDDLALFPAPVGGSVSRNYRRWAVESAALDLALRQASTHLAACLGLRPAPVRFVLSCGLGSPPSAAPVTRRLAVRPDLQFKIDWSRGVSPAVLAELAGTGAIVTVDLKGHYRGGEFRGPDPDAAGYRAVAEAFEVAWIEDPWLDADTDAALAPFRDRLTWDAPLHSLGDIVALPFPPRAINVKPSRFGRLSELFAVYEHCRCHGIAMYGGGQFELGPGRGQIQLLAALFHPDGANDVAPVSYHGAATPEGLEQSPLEPCGAPVGFGRDGSGLLA